MLLSFSCHTSAARTWVRAWNQLLQLYASHFEIRLQKTKSGMRLRSDTHYADINVDALSGGLNFRVQFSEDCDPSLRGRTITLLGAYLALVERTEPNDGMNIDNKRTKLGDVDTVRKWGQWALDSIYKQFPDQLKVV